MPSHRPEELVLDIVSRLSAAAAAEPEEGLTNHLASSLGESFPDLRIEVVWAPDRSRRKEAGHSWHPDTLATSVMGRPAIREVQLCRSEMEYWRVDTALDFWFLRRQDPDRCVLMLRRASEGVGGWKPVRQRRERELWMAFSRTASDMAKDEFDELLMLTQYVLGIQLI